MSAKKVQAKGWPVKAVDAPKVSNRSWMGAGVLGVVFIAMAVLQLVSFSDFKDDLDALGLAGPSTWAVLIILAEFWGAAGFFKLRLSRGFRTVSYGLAVLVAGFWFLANVQATANGLAAHSSGFFGRFLNQTPGWWSVIEVTIFLFWVLSEVSALYNNQQKRP